MIKTENMPLTKVINVCELSTNMTTINAMDEKGRVVYNLQDLFKLAFLNHGVANYQTKGHIGQI